MDANLHNEIKRLFRVHNINDALFALEEFAYHVNKLKAPDPDSAEAISKVVKLARSCQDLNWIMFR